MNRGYSIETEVPSAFVAEYNRFVFHDHRHLILQGDDLITFFLVRKSARTIVAEISFHIQKDRAVSPLRAPFGSFLFSEGLSTQNLFTFISECEVRLRKIHVKSIFIKEPPLSYNFSRQRLQSLLINQGYAVVNAEIGACITVDDEKFSTKIAASEKSKIRLAKEAGMVASQIQLTDLEKVYDFIKYCNSQRGHKPSMTIADLSKTVGLFDKAFVLFGTFLKDELTSASVAIKVGNGVLYNFYLAHQKKYDSVSPVVLLIGEMYKFCATHKLRLMDLGTSAISGQPNFSLLDFKFRLGTEPTMKLMFEKQLL